MYHDAGPRDGLDGMRQTIALADRRTAGYDDRIALVDGAIESRFKLVGFIAQRRIMTRLRAHQLERCGDA